LKLTKMAQNFKAA
jgi:hypothetical protein